MDISVLHLVEWSQSAHTQRFFSPSFIVRHKYKILGELNKCTEHFAIQKGGIQHFHPVNRHWRVSSNLTLLQLNFESVSLMLEDYWSEKSSKRDNQTSTLLSMELKSPLSYFCTNSFKADFPLQAKNVHRNVGHMNPNTNLVLWAVFHWQWTVFKLISSLVKSTWALRTSTFSSGGKRTGNG